MPLEKPRNDINQYETVIITITVIFILLADHIRNIYKEIYVDIHILFQNNSIYQRGSISLM